MLHFGRCQLLCFFKLCRCELHLPSVRGISTSTTRIYLVCIRFQISWVNIAISIMVSWLRWWRLLLATRGAVLLSNSSLKLANSILLNLLPHLFFFSEPLIFLISVVLVVLRTLVVIPMAYHNGWCLWHHLPRFRNCFDNVVLTPSHRGNSSRNRHVPHHIVKFFVIIVLIVILII